MCSKVENLLLQCRTCLVESLDKRYEIEELPISLYKLLQQCIGDEAQEGWYPSFICKSCFEQLKSFEEFQTLSRKSTLFLKNLIKTQTVASEEPSINMKKEIYNDNQHEESIESSKVFTLNLEEHEDELSFEEVSLKVENITDALENEINCTQNSPKKRKSRCKRDFNQTNKVKKKEFLKGINKKSTKNQRRKQLSLICEDCGQTFDRISKLHVHSYTHRPPEDRPFKCNLCDKSFIVKRNYQDHLDRHAGTKNFECSECGLKKFTVRELKLHMNWHTKERQFPCELCPKVFNARFNLKRHQELVHFGIRKHKCRHCGQMFGEAATLKIHEMIHTGEKPHQCTVCNRSFRQRKLLTTHLRTHHQ